MRPTVIIITHTDWKEPNPDWPHQPRLPFRRDDPQSWNFVMEDLGDRAQVDAIAIGCRGTFDPEAVAALPLARAAWGRARTQPAVTFWGDTVGLPDITYNLDGRPFDFANPQHIEWALDYFFLHFFRHFGDAKLLQVEGKTVIPMWGIRSDTGHGFVNQHKAQRLLDAVDAKWGARFLVDRTWAELVPNLNVLGVHDWFDPWATPPKSFTTRLHNGVRTGVVVSGFTDPGSGVQKIPHSGDTARRGLQACSGCHYIIGEGATDYAEDAHWLIDSAGDDSKLTAIREVTGVPAEPQQPIGGLMHLAITTVPILAWKTGVLVQSPLASNRYAMRWTQRPNEAGFPDASSSKFMCLNPDGSTEAKDVIGEWESSQPVNEGDVEIRWFTMNAAQDHSYVRVYGLQQFKVA